MKRSEVESRLKWDLSGMFESDEQWYERYEAFKTMMERMSDFRGKLSDRAELLKALRMADELGREVTVLYVYAHCRRDEDTKEDKYNVMYGTIQSAYARLSAIMSFIEPELTGLDEAVLVKRIEDKEFSDYDYFLKTVLRSKPHILSQSEEKLLAMTADFAHEFSNVFTMIDNADLDCPEIEIDGEKVKLTHGAYANAIQHHDQRVRKEAFEKYYGSYLKHINTLAANYNGEVKKNIFYARARKYPTYLDNVLMSEDVPRKVYETLIESVGAGLEPLHEYVAYRKERLGLDKYYMYDMYVPIFEGVDYKPKYEEACSTVADSLEILGKDYADTIRASFRDRWIDVMETDNKRSGAYCTHAYKAPHPYVLMNYSASTRDIFTLTHELGHAMHSKYSSEKQPYAKSDYKIFVAEVASTVNEMLLMEHLFKTIKDENIKRYLLSYKLDTFRTTIFRQTMFSEFELKTHEMAQNGEPLSLRSLSDMYDQLNTRYYGSSVTHDDFIQYEWARIPHFYMSFYVYKYATGLITAVNIADRLVRGEKGMREKYMNFLSAGGSKSPYDILRDVGVDLATEAPYKAVMQSFKKTLEELKRL